jgi:DNA invertase Pin-like site-specific DNA recombinase
VSGLLIGYARVSTDEQDLTAQRNALLDLGVLAERVYVDHGLTGTHRDRPGCAKRSAPAAPATRSSSRSSTGSRSLPDARDIVEDLTCRQVKLNLGGRCMTRPIRSGGWCSTRSRWSPSSKPI